MKIRRVRTRYWRPKADYTAEVASALLGIVEDGDIIAVSEKALTIASGNILDEADIKPGFSAKMLARLWMRIVWGYLLSYLCRLKPLTILRLRKYPAVEGARHKQLVLEKTGIIQALRFGSEGGIDASNLPHYLVSIPLKDPAAKAEEICRAVLRETGKRTVVIVVDSDKTYSFRSIHFSPIPTEVRGVLTNLGFGAYIVGRFLKLKPRATPKAIYPPTALTAEEALNIAELAHQVMGHGAGRTIWDVAERFNVGLTDVTWEMLSSLKHYPIVIARKSRNSA